MQRDTSLLLDMFRATSRIVQFKGELTFERFRTDAKTQSAIIHQFLLIDEVAKLISDDFKKKIRRFHGRLWHVCGISSYITIVEWICGRYGKLPRSRYPDCFHFWKSICRKNHPKNKRSL